MAWLRWCFSCWRLAFNDTRRVGSLMYRCFWDMASVAITLLSLRQLMPGTSYHSSPVNKWDQLQLSHTWVVLDCVHTLKLGGRWYAMSKQRALGLLDVFLVLIPRDDQCWLVCVTKTLEILFDLVQPMAWQSRRPDTPSDLCCIVWIFAPCGWYEIENGTFTWGEIHSAHL